jgi:hypothetical protein
LFPKNRYFCTIFVIHQKNWQQYHPLVHVKVRNIVSMKMPLKCFLNPLIFSEPNSELQNSGNKPFRSGSSDRGGGRGGGGSHHHSSNPANGGPASKWSNNSSNPGSGGLRGQQINPGDKIIR